MKLLKKYGQNFLQDPGYARQIAAALASVPHDNIIEIGPGSGVLTTYIARGLYEKLQLIEIDARCVEMLKRDYGSNKNIEIINSDFLRYDFQFYWGEPKKQIKVIGNIPYYITSQILFKLLDNYRYISRIVLMVQKEVANRLTAECGSKDYGITSIFLATMGEAQVLFDIGKENFKPVPKVDSSVIMVEFNRTTDEILDYHIFVNLVRGTFQTRRKKIKNSLDRIIGASNTARIRSIDLNCRPENLSPDEFKVLANEVYSFSN